MGLRASRRRLTRPDGGRVVVREYGRDSLLVWANLLLAPLFAALGLRVGLQSDEQLRARIQADATAMRRRGYLVTSTEVRSLPVIGRPTSAATWYRVTYERAGSAPPPES